MIENNTKLHFILVTIFIVLAIKVFPGICKDHGSHHHVHKDCNISTATTSTYYINFNYTGDLDPHSGPSCHVIYTCKYHSHGHHGHHSTWSKTRLIRHHSPSCDPFVYNLVLFESQELPVRVHTLGLPDFWLLYKEITFESNTITIRQRMKKKRMPDFSTKLPLPESSYSCENRKLPVQQFEETYSTVFLHQKIITTTTGSNNSEIREWKGCLKNATSSNCDSNLVPDPLVRAEVESYWNETGFNGVSGYVRMFMFINNPGMNRSQYYGQDGDGWTVIDTIVRGALAPDWHISVRDEALWFTKLWMDGCVCARDPGNEGKNLAELNAICAKWDQLHPIVVNPYPRPASLKYCPSLQVLDNMKKQMGA